MQNLGAPAIPATFERWHLWYDQAAGDDADEDPQAAPAAPRVPRGPVPPANIKLTTLGLLKHANHRYFKFFEWKYLLFIKETLTLNWYRVMTGTSGPDMTLWLEIFLVLELDRKSQVDLMLLAHSGEVGRAMANEILWTILSEVALKDSYLDMSNKVSALVNLARRSFDRPPRRHRDIETWGWNLLLRPSLLHRQHWSPLAPPPPNTTLILTLEGGEPVPPPQCWHILGQQNPGHGGHWAHQGPQNVVESL